MPLNLPRLQHSLRARITLLVSVLVFAGIWGLTLPLATILQGDLEKTITDGFSTTVGYITTHIDQEIQLRTDALNEISASITPDIQGDPAKIQSVLEQRKFSRAIFPGGLFVADRQGLGVADFPAQPGRRGRHFAGLDYFRAVMADGQPVVGRPTLDPSAKVPLVVIAVPIRDAGGATVGVLAAPVFLQDKDLFGVLERTPIGQTGHLVVASSKDNLIVSASDRSRILTPLHDGGTEGGDALQVSATMATTGWLVQASIPRDDAFAPLIKLKRQLYLAALTISLLTALLLRFLLIRQLTPLTEAGSAIRRMSTSQDPLAPIPLRRDDEVGYLVRSFNQLVAERTRAEDALRQSEAHLKLAMEVAKIGTWERNLASGAGAWSAQTKAIMGLESDAYTFDDFLLRIHPDDLPRMREVLAVSVAGKPFEHEYRIVRPSGEVRWVNDRGQAICDAQGRTERVLGATLDITERRATEDALQKAKAEAERANRAKSRFLAAASHDLRQPLSALSIYVNMLKGSVKPDGQPLVANLKDCIGSLSELLTDLLDLSKLEAGVVAPNRSDFAVADALASLVAVHAPEAQLKGLRLRYVASELTVHTDPVLFRRIVGNLIDNAIHYTERGGVLVGCRRRRGKTWVEVWDTGIGIPEDKTAEIFEEFKQLGDEARTRGSGLGLAIVAKTAALLGLEISVGSRPGRGSVFAVELPHGQAPVIPAPEPRQAVYRSLRVALVEDNAMVREAFVLGLQGAGHQVVAAASGPELLAGLGSLAPDIVVSDYRLAQGQTGFDVITTLRAAMRADLPAILITGDTDPTLVRSMTDRGIIVLHKPLDLETLQAYLEDLTYQDCAMPRAHCPGAEPIVVASRWVKPAACASNDPDSASDSASASWVSFLNSGKSMRSW